MRPHKRVLLYCADAAELVRVRFVLATRMFDVASAGDVDDVVREAASSAFDCAVVLGSQACVPRCECVVRGLREAVPELPVLLALDAGLLPPSWATVVGRTSEMALMIDSIKTLCARKRGPKKKLSGCAAIAAEQAVGIAG